MSVTGVYNTYRFGVLQNYFERVFNPHAQDIIRYIELYEKYQGLKEQDNPKMAMEMEDTMSLIREIERGYRADIVFGLRKAINERYYGFKQADKIYDMKIQEIFPKKKEHARRKSGFLDMFRKHSEEVEEEDP
jgi:hypothetical protein